MWHLISNAPFDRDLELALIDSNGVHAICFPFRRVLGGWIKAETKTPINVHPTHWRDWSHYIEGSARHLDGGFRIARLHAQV
jgi:hypothetical protein